MKPSVRGTRPAGGAEEVGGGPERPERGLSWPSMSPIGFIRSSWPDKFGVPRQPRLATSARAILKLEPGIPVESVRGIETFSHVWVIFLFHAVGEGWKPTVRPPRLGGTDRMGVFATRSPYRPNRVGLSAVVLERVDAGARGGVELFLGGGDFVDGTPVLDLKPYLPYADAVPEASAGWAKAALVPLPVEFPAEIQAFLEERGEATCPDLLGLVREVLEQDPRPAYAAGRTGRYVVAVGPADVGFRVEEGRVIVMDARERAG